MNKMKITGIAIAVILVLFVLLGPYFILQEGRLAVVTRFGKIIRTETEAGLKLKMPFLDQVKQFPKKIQSWDGEAQPLPTGENQLIWVDTTARWKIADAKLFYESVGTINQANSRLDDVIDSSVRKIIANNLLYEAVRNSNIINEIERENVYQNQIDAPEGDPDVPEIRSIFTNIKYDSVKKGRKIISDEMLIEAQKNTPKYGIDLIDIIVRQIKYSDDLTKSVFDRMIKDRNQIAQAFRSAGEGEKAKWLGQMEKELRDIRSTAERTAKEKKAMADAQSLEIRNRAYTKDPEFADFWMALKEYETLLPKMKKILTTDLEFFKYLYDRMGRDR